MEPAASRFVRVDVALPSPDVFALALYPAVEPRFLFVGTSEGLARVRLEEMP
jgi:hypothetical protein